MQARLSITKQSVIELWPEDSDLGLGEMVEISEGTLWEYKTAQRNFNEAMAKVRAEVAYAWTGPTVP